MQDLRLFLPAVLLWVGVAKAGEHSLLVAGGGAIVLAFGLYGLRTWPAEPSWVRLIVIVGACVSAGHLAGFAHVALADSDPITRAAYGESYVRVEAEALSHPVQSDIFGAPAFRAEFRARRVEYGGSTSTSNETVRVTGRGNVLAEVARGDVIVFAAKLKESESADSVSAYATIDSIESHSRAKGLQAVANFLHENLMDRTQHLPSYAAGLIPGVVVGDDSRLPDAEVDIMRVLSLSHLTAVSGSHISLVLGGLAAILGRRLRFLTATMSLGGLHALVTLVGPEPSVLRAGYMGFLMCVALALRRPAVAFPLLAVTVMGTALADPHLATSLGFRLSAVATGAIVVFGYRVRAALSFLPVWMAELVSIPLVAGIATMPIVLGLQEVGSVWAVLANILAAPVVAPLTIAGLLGTLSLGIEEILGIVGPSVPLFAIAIACTWWLHQISQVLIDWPGSHVAPQIAFLANILVLAILIGVHVLHSHDVLDARAARIAMVVGILVAGLAGWFGLSRSGGGISKEWEIFQCDVGQGSATLIRTGTRVILVDVGNADSGIGECVNRAEISHIDLLVLTHFDSDHVRGLEELLNSATVTTAWMSENSNPSRNSSWVRERLEADHVELAYVSQGAEFDDSVAILSPRTAIGHEESTNDDSLVVSVRTAHHHLLILADTGERVQDVLATSEALSERVAEHGPVDVVAIAHHGSADQSPRLAKTLRPVVTLVAVGENSYGHPTTQALRDWSAPVLKRTDLCGAIVVSAEYVETEEQCDTRRNE